MENEVLSRNDMLEPEPPKQSLPPALKFGRDVWGDVFLLAIVGFSLLAAKWEVMKPESFEKVIFGVLFIKATMITGRGISLDALPFMKR